MGVGGLLLALVAVPSLRRITWIGDLQALALPALGVALVVLDAGLLSAGAPGTVMAGVIGLFAGCVLHCVLPRRRVRSVRPDAPLVLASVNLQYDSEDPEATVQSALEVRADVLVVAEVTARTHPLLSAAFPYAVVTEHALRVNDNAVGIYAHVPFEELSAPPRTGRESLRVRVQGPHPFVLYAVHLPRPVLRHDGSTGLVSLAEHRRDVHRLDRAIRAEVEPVVLAGDLNLSDRTDRYRVLTAGRLDAMRTNRLARSTYRGGWRWRWLLFRIDHCIVPADWAVSDAATFAIQASDHRGIRAHLAPSSAKVCAPS
jgi:endonuclease/exonuclease/phosphatase (EEP) superfamily protein YafD